MYLSFEETAIPAGIMLIIKAIGCYPGEKFDFFSKNDYIIGNQSNLLSIAN